MNKEELFQKFCEKELEKFTKVLRGAAEEAISVISHDYLPHLGTDTETNVEYRVDEVLRKLLNGDYTVEDGYLRVDEPYVSLNIKVTSYHWDKFRNELIKLMPKCPKDAEIEMLRETLRIEREMGRGW